MPPRSLEISFPRGAGISVNRDGVCSVSILLNMQFLTTSEQRTSIGQLLMVFEGCMRDGRKQPEHSLSAKQPRRQRSWTRFNQFVAITERGDQIRMRKRAYFLQLSTLIALCPKGRPPHFHAMRRCGQYADGFITDPKTWKEHKGEFQKGASDAGKDPARMPISYGGWRRAF